MPFLVPWDRIRFGIGSGSAYRSNVAGVRKACGVGPPLLASAPRACSASRLLAKARAGTDATHNLRKSRLSLTSILSRHDSPFLPFRIDEMPGIIGLGPSSIRSPQIY